MNPTERAEDFLHRQGIHPDCASFGEVEHAFVSEMRAGLAGTPSSLRMIPTYLSPGGSPADGQTALAVDIGGTNLRLALTRFRGGRVEIVDSNLSPVPGTREEITKEEFLRRVAGLMSQMISLSDRVGICFSHSAEILPNKDGRLISFSKEIRVTGAAGMEICRELSGKLRELGITAEKKYVLLNDTAAVLLGGAADTAGRACRGQIGFVLGTGMNISYAERAGDISKSAGLFGGEAMIVNTEAGGFDKAPFGALDRAFFGTTADPGEHLFEKITSGRYLGELVLFAAKAAAAEGLLSAGAAAGVGALTTLSTPETSAFLSNPLESGTLSDLCRDERDRAVLTAVTGRVSERSAKLTAAAIAAVISRMDAGDLGGRRVCLTAEGSTFHKLYLFRGRFEHCLRERFAGGDGCMPLMMSVENATLVGTALAAMTQD